MKRIIKLTESDLTRIVRRVIMEETLKVDQIVRIKDNMGMGTLKVRIEKSTNNGYQGMIEAHSGDFGSKSGQMKMTNVAIGDLVTIKMIDGTNVSVSIPDTYKKPVNSKIEK